MEKNSEKTPVMQDDTPVTPPVLSIPISLTQISSLLPLLISYSFFLSSIYTLIFFVKIGIDPLSIPLTISDYVVAFSVWAFLIIYFLIVILLAFITKYVCGKEEEKKNIVLVNFTIILLIISTITPLIHHVYNNICITLLISIVGLLLFFIITTNFFNSRIDSKYILPFSVFIIFSLETCILFVAQIEYQLRDSTKNIKTFYSAGNSISGSLLRSFDKGIIIYQLPNKIKNNDDKARIFFLPYDNGHILEFSTDLALPVPKTTPPSTPLG